MAGRRISNEAEARRCLAAAKASRAGLGPWARTHGIDGRSLNAWRVNLQRRGLRVVRARPQLVEIVPVAPVAVARAPYVLRVGGVEVEVTGFEEASLRRLVVLLKSC